MVRRLCFPKDTCMPYLQSIARSVLNEINVSRVHDEKRPAALGVQQDVRASKWYPIRNRTRPQLGRIEIVFPSELRLRVSAAEAERGFSPIPSISVLLGRKVVSWTYIPLTATSRVRCGGGTRVQSNTFHFCSSREKNGILDLHPSAICVRAPLRWCIRPQVRSEMLALIKQAGYRRRSYEHAAEVRTACLLRSRERVADVETKESAVSHIFRW